MIVPEFKFVLNDGLEKTFLPTQANETDTGWDVRCAQPNGVLLKPFDHALIPLGFRVMAPSGWWLELRPRSSSHAKKHLNCLYGVIDESYEGQVYLSCQYIPPLVYDATSPSGYLERRLTVLRRNMDLYIKHEEKIGQLVPALRQNMLVTEITTEEYDKLSMERQANRGTGGFGSTD